MEDLQTGATLDRYAADQVIPFAALAAGESRFRIPQMSHGALHTQSFAMASPPCVHAPLVVLLMQGGETTPDATT